jgi:Subtilisin inhibitor-like
MRKERIVVALLEEPGRVPVERSRSSLGPVARSTRPGADNPGMRRLLSCLVAAAATVLCLSVPAVAQEGSEASLVITVYDGADTSWPKLTEVTLKCHPTGGTHAAAENACDALDAVDGDLGALPQLNVVCPMVYQPVTVEVGGSWRDRVVAFEADYGNLCVAFAESGGVFRF